MDCDRWVIMAIIRNILVLFIFHWISCSRAKTFGQSVHRIASISQEAISDTGIKKSIVLNAVDPTSHNCIIRCPRVDSVLVTAFSLKLNTGPMNISSAVNCCQSQARYGATPPPWIISPLEQYLDHHMVPL
ncbi:hypothetical protein CAPTEDRAFT_207426 [Capitella teleta]|uniref:Uncharacterized protein n=1 Tax=Capitella teleta TaxID=283909 RepID=R7TLP3_CAPTE|nr:hypothetical protein CAPTEDRAFT_207426 [Capitella teleta]|eukprot:ELT94589.1 hypothetical protein CAPTEDRAFT_207426 [Capitella teleta]